MRKTDDTILRILLWTCIALLTISNLLMFRYASKVSNATWDDGYKVGIIQGQWDYVNGIYHSRELWTTASPIAGNQTVARVVRFRELACAGLVEQHPDYPVDCDE